MRSRSRRYTTPSISGACAAVRPSQRKAGSWLGPSISTSWTEPSSVAALPGEAVLGLLDPPGALLGDLRRHRVGQRRGRRPLLGGVDEAPDAVERHVVQEFEERLEGRLRLPREADEHGRPEGRARDRLAERRDDLGHAARGHARRIARSTPSSACWIGMSTYGTRAPGPSFATSPSVTCAGCR